VPYIGGIRGSLILMIAWIYQCIFRSLSYSELSAAVIIDPVAIDEVEQIMKTRDMWCVLISLRGRQAVLKKEKAP
jgi:hypothetical protein